MSKRPKDWRERKAQRQKYWSLSQGFRFGRKLADWGGFEEGDPRAQLPPLPQTERDSEDADMQEAIRRSLIDAQGKSSRLFLFIYHSLLSVTFQRNRHLNFHCILVTSHLLATI